MKLPTAAALAGVSGFIALSYEMLWIRVYSFLSGGTPWAFSDLLAAYLAGLAAGALWVQRLAKHKQPAQVEELHRQLHFQRKTLIWFFLGSSIAAFLSIPLVAAGAHLTDWSEAWALLVFAGVATLMGVVFPLLTHYAVKADLLAGQNLSLLYAANITGSVAGSLLTGLIALDFLSLRECALGLTIAGLLVTLALLLSNRSTQAGVTALTVGGLLSSIAILHFLSVPLYKNLYERLQYRTSFDPSRTFIKIIENRSGVVSVSASGTVYGNGFYDGVYNVNPIPYFDRNRSLRAYLIPTLFRNPESILMVGLGSGSWLQILANYPSIREIVVVEINPGYIESASSFNVVASALQNPKVTIIVDDGRRYLTRESRRFDVIVQNTTAHWRSHSTNLLSREHLLLSKSHLSPGGVLVWNSTGSVAAQRTGALTFPYALRFQNMMIGSDRPIPFEPDHWKNDLVNWRIEGEPVLAARRADALANDIVDPLEWRGIPSWETREEILTRTTGAPTITDDNMAGEWVSAGTYP